MPDPDWPLREHGRVVDTGRLRVYGVQTGSGPDLLLLHGVGGSTHCWAPLIPLLQHHWRVTALDLPGHGFTSPPPDSRLTPEGMRDDLAAAMEAFECDPEVLVGHSAGAALALMIAAQRSRPARLVLGVNPSLARPERMPMPRWIETFARPFVRAGAFAQFWATIGRSPAMLRRVLVSTGSPTTADQRTCYARIASSPSHVHAALTMMVQWDDAAVARAFGLVGRGAQQVVLLAGDRDRWIPVPVIQRVAARISGAEVRTFDAGHLGPEERPGDIARLITRLTAERPSEERPSGERPTGA